MQASSPDAFTRSNLEPDERREWIRIDDHLLLEYRLLSDPADESNLGLPPVTPEMILAAVNKPTVDLLARSGDVLAGSPLLPWIMKVDWLLEIILKAMAAQNPASMTIARMTDVNISGGGISFPSSRQFAVGDRLALKIILPPFTPVHTIANVTRSTAHGEGPDFIIGTQFEDLPAHDQDHIVRHVIHLQAERLRARRDTRVCPPTPG